MDGHPSSKEGDRTRYRPAHRHHPGLTCSPGEAEQHPHGDRRHPYHLRPARRDLAPEQFDRIVARASFLTSPVWKGAPGEWTRMAIAHRYEGDGSWTSTSATARQVDGVLRPRQQPAPALDAGIKIETGW